MKNITNVIIANPLNGFARKSFERPDWLCNHSEAKVINHENKIYRCDKCRKLAYIKVIPQMRILSALSENATNPENQPPS
jgi:hypothetical protein